MRVGVLVQMAREKDIDTQFAEVKEMGMESCQLVCWDRSLFTDENADKILAAKEKYGIDITAFWCGWPGPKIWNFYGGQETLGLVPVAYRFERMQALFEGSDFAAKLNVPDLVTHVGFIPENPYDGNYSGIVHAVKSVADYCAENNQAFLFETGQETPITLLRIIQDIGSTNLGINLDPANLILYGKANPVDALEVFGKYVRGIHGKDGLYPTDGHELGKEVPLGQGRVNFPVFIARLKEIGYNGDITIEREITGDEQKRDILEAKRILEQLI